MRSRPRVTYPFIGLLLGAGAPIGSFLVRLVVMPEVRHHPVDDLATNAFFYLYELVGSALVFAIAGFLTGHRVERLRRGREFYHDLAEHDALTGLHNSRAFMDRYRRALERAVVTQLPIAVVLIDVDKLKAVNDSFGHLSGNDALLHVADALLSSKRSTDLAARWGGDEFSILLEGADSAAAMRVANGIMAHLARTPLMLQKTPVTITVTIGVACAERPSLSSDLFAAADRALFAGKAQGRNVIEVVTV